jgi:hypothetical protein
MKAKKTMAKSGSLKKAKMGMGVYGKAGSDMSSSDTMMRNGGAKKKSVKNKPMMYGKGGAAKMKKGSC